MSLTTEEHQVLIRIEKHLEAMNGLLRQLCERLTPVVDELEVLSDKLSPKTPEPITPCGDKDYECMLKQFLLTRSELTREDKVGSGTYILHDIQVTDENLWFKNGDVIDARLKPRSYVLFVSEKMLYICGDDFGTCTYLSAYLEPGVSVLASAHKSGMLNIKGFAVIKTKNKKENHGA